MNENKKLLSLPMATALVVGSMIGSGIFLLPATMAPYGGVSALAWVFTGGGAVLLALTFAWLSRMRAVGSGIYAYASLAFGDFVGFLVGWCYWIGIWVSTSALAIAAVSYLSALVPALAESRALAGGTALAMLWSITAVNLHSVRSSGSFQLAATILKVAPLILLIVLGLPHFDVSHFEPFNPTDKPLTQATATAAALAMWAMLGLEAAAVASGKVGSPERNVARATVWGTLLAALLTAGLCTAAMGIVDPALLAKSNSPMADVARVVWGEFGGKFIAALGAFSAFGCLNGWVLSQGALPQAMARDGLLPAFMARENARGSPVMGILAGSVLASALIISNSTQTLIGLFTFLALLSTLANLVPYLFTSMAALMLMKRDGPVPLTRGRAAVLLLAAAFAIWMIYGAGQETVFWGFLLLMSGLPVYVWLRRGTAAVAT